MTTTYTRSVTLDLNCVQPRVCVYAKRGDNASRYLCITLTAKGAQVIPQDMTAVIRCAKPDGTYVENPAAINEDGTITAELSQQILAVSGEVKADLCLYGDGGEVLSTAPFLIQVEPAPEGEAVRSSSEFLQLLADMSRSRELIGACESRIGQLQDILTAVRELSPVVSVTEAEGGHLVTVTDQNGTQSFLVADGSQGPAGENGTATDEQVAFWLEAHPDVTTSVLDGSVTPEKTTFINYQRETTAEQVPNFTNQIPISTDAEGNIYNGKGWKENTRINSSGEEVEVEGFHATGFIPCAPGDVVRSGTGVISGTNDNQALSRYDASKTFLGRISYNAFESNGFTVSEDGALHAPQSASVTDLAYIRIVGARISDESVVTVNEEVTYTAVEMESAAVNLTLDETVAVPLAQQNQERIALLEANAQTLEETVRAMTETAVPDYVKNEAQRVAALVCDVSGGDTFCFAAVSDIHYIPSAENTPAIRHMGQAVKLIRDLVPLDAAAILGDTISGASEDSLETCKSCYAFVNGVIADAAAGIPNMRLNGNHDCQPYNHDGFFTQSQIFARVGAWNAGAETEEENRGGNYGYWDFKDRKIRIIYLNTCDVDGIQIKSQAADFTGNRIGVRQLSWLIDTLKAVPDGWGILLMGHHPLDWVSNSYTDADGIQWEQNTVNAVQILSDYAQGSAGSVWLEGTQVTYDFSGDNGGEIIAYFHGHTHNFKVSTMGAGKILRIAIPNALPGRENEYTSMDGMYEETTYTKTTGTAEDTAFCIVSVNTKDRIICLHHYGAGYDREITY